MKKEQIVGNLLIELEKELGATGELTVSPVSLTKSVFILKRYKTDITDYESSCIRSKLSGDSIYFCKHLRRFLFEGYILEISETEKTCIVFSEKLLSAKLEEILKGVAYLMTPYTIRISK